MVSLSSTAVPSSHSIYQPELAHPYEVLAPHVTIDIASPNGGASPLDPSSVEASKEDAVSVKFHKNNEKLWKNTAKLSSFLGKADDYEAIFFVGGHGRTCLFICVSPIREWSAVGIGSTKN